LNPKINEIWQVIGHLKQARKLKRMLDAEWIDTHQFYQRLLRFYRKYLASRGYDPDNPPAFDPAKDEDWHETQEIVLGFTRDGLPIGLSITNLCRAGIVILGRPGAGKTNAFVAIAKQLMEIK
jgi:hypothetical protein